MKPICLALAGSVLAATAWAQNTPMQGSNLPPLQEQTRPPDASQRLPAFVPSAPTSPGPYQPAPYQPGPIQPTPYQQGPIQPTPYQQGPTQPAPYQPGPTQPAPYQPAPTQQAPYQPAPTQPAPYQPAPTQPAPYQPGPAPSAPVPSAPKPYVPAAPLPTFPNLPKPGAQAPPAPATPPASADRPNIWVPAGSAKLVALDKVNAQATELTVTVGQSATFGSLTITVKACSVRPPDQPADAAAYLHITDSHVDAPGFDGWMLRDEPSVSMMQHPIYDLRVAGCT
jgi:hypothetical protein